MSHFISSEHLFCFGSQRKINTLLFDTCGCFEDCHVVHYRRLLLQIMFDVKDKLDIRKNK